MICPICEKNLEIIEREGNIFEDDFSGMVRYAVCRDCKKQWKLKNATESTKKKSRSTEEDHKQINVVGEDKGSAPPDLASLVNATKAKAPSDETIEEEDSGNPAKSIGKNEGEDRPRRKRKGAPSSREGKPGARPRTPSRDSGERPKNRPKPLSRENQDELGVSGDKRRYPSRDMGESPKDKPRSLSKETGDKPKGPRSNPSAEINRGRPHREQKTDSESVHSKPSPIPGFEDDDDTSDVLFKPVRLVLAGLSIVAFIYLAIQAYWTYYLDLAIDRGDLSAFFAVCALAIFCLAAGIVLFVTLKKDGLLPFIVPSFLYLIGGVIAFFFRGDSRILLSGSIVALIVAIVLIILILIDKVKNIEEE